MGNWVVVITNSRGPSVVGPFDTSEKAAEYGNSILPHVDGDVRISTINPVPAPPREPATI